jgi:transglutaminase-like putative cysteine protease
MQNKRIVLIFILVLIFGCKENNFQESPEEYIRDSEASYSKAVSLYKELISKSDNPSLLYFKLGELYFRRGEYNPAINAFNSSSQIEAKKFLALSFYRLGNFTDALEIFNREKIPDDEYLYYFGLTCERLNLFDQAIKVYKQIKGAEFRSLAGLRLDEIQRQAGILNIKEADPEIAKILNNAPDAKLYPQAGALILLANENIEITEKDTQESTVHYLVKVLNERGKESFAESAIEYDSTFEKIELVYARTIKPDGSVVYVGSRHIRDVSKYLNFPLYSNARVLIISFPEVSMGGALEYKIKIKRSQLVNKKDVFFSYPVQAYEPIIFAEFNLTLPKEKSLKVKAINEEYNYFGADLKPVQEENNGNLIYRWRFKDIPQIIPEPNMPEDTEINPAILLSTFNSWQDIYSWWWGLAKDKIKTDKSIKAEVKRLIKGKLTDLEKARAIYNFCAKDIRYVAVEYGDAGYEPHSAGEILRNKYGDCKDQAVLLVTMLREAGLKAFPVLIGTKQYYNLNQDFPSALFNHCIAALYLGNKIIFLDPTAETCSFGDLPLADQGRMVLVFKDDSYNIEMVPLYPGGHNFVKQELKLKINGDESISGAKINVTLGAYDQKQRYWLLYTQPELIEDTLKNIIQEVSIGARLVNYKIDNLNDLNTPVLLSYDFRGPEYFTKAGTLRIMPQLASIDTSLIAKEERKYPIDFGLLDKHELYLEITIPKNFVIQYMPGNIKYDSPWLSFTQEYSFKNNKLYFKQLSYNKTDKVAKEEYANFKGFLENLARSIKQRVVLEKLR